MEFNNTLLVKYLFEDLTEAEMEMLMAWRKESPANKAFFATLVKVRLSYKYKEITSEKTITAFSQVNKKISKGVSFRLFKQAGKYAAIIVFLISFSFGVGNYLSKDHQDVSISVSEGESIKKLNLPDGTVVWLNEGSTLKIPETFSFQKRTVKLTGEAYFDVKKNQKSPFLVDASSMQVKVVGTSFNLKNRPEDGMVETILVTGKVLLLDKDGNQVYDMFPGEKVVYLPQSNEYIVNTVDTNVSTAWHLNQLRFENTSLREIVNKLSLIYDVNINLESKKLADRKYRCVINRDETLQQVLDILSYLAPIKYRIEGDEVFIYE